MSNLIAIGGKFAAGKDVVANYYHFEFGFEVVGFSDPLNELLITLDPYVMKEGSGIDLLRYSQIVKSVGYVNAKKIPEVRRLLQVFGTEVGRKGIYENIWTDLAFKKIFNIMQSGKSVVITGVRFTNELEMVKRLDGHTLWIERPGHEQTGEHASENSVESDMFDSMIINDSTIGALENKAGELLMGLRAAD